jgi:wobble nucleotide-excising tRNase
MGEEILVVKKDRNEDKIKVKITERRKNMGLRAHDPFISYQKVIPNKDFNHLAQLLYDLHSMGYNVDKAIARYKEFLNEPELFFL